MKKQIILKVFILNMVLASSLFSASLSSTEITNMVAEIKKKRKGVSLSILETTQNPFVMYVPPKKEFAKPSPVLMISPKALEVVYTLKAILNHAAFIDKKWYKQGDRLGEYKVGYVSSSSVVLKSENGNKTLRLANKKKSFIKSNRGYR